MREGSIDIGRMGILIGEVRSEEDVRNVISNLLSRVRKPWDFVNIMYLMIDLGYDSFCTLLEDVRGDMEDALHRIGFDHLKVMLFYISRTCPRCLDKFLSLFREMIDEKLSERHFNDVMVLIIDMSILSEQSAVVFIRHMEDTIRRLAMSEGFKHFGTVVWYIAMMKKTSIAMKLFDVLFEIIKRKSSSLTDIADMLFWFVRADKNLGIHALRMMHDIIVELIEKTNLHDLAGFLLITSKDKRLKREVSSKILPRIRKVAIEKGYMERLRLILSTLGVENKLCL